MLNWSLQLHMLPSCTHAHASGVQRMRHRSKRCGCPHHICLKMYVIYLRLGEPALVPTKPGNRDSVFVFALRACVHACMHTCVLLNRSKPHIRVLLLLLLLLLLAVSRLSPCECLSPFAFRLLVSRLSLFPFPCSVLPFPLLPFPCSLFPFLLWFLS